MPRPRKWRKVCCLPQNDTFGPMENLTQDGDWIRMSIDEYETIRLIDFEDMTQEECAERMEVARGTVQSMYKEARKKLSLVLVQGLNLKIEGGDYKLCEEGDKFFGCRRCRGNSPGGSLQSCNE